MWAQRELACSCFAEKSGVVCLRRSHVLGKTLLILFFSDGCLEHP